MKVGPGGLATLARRMPEQCPRRLALHHLRPVEEVRQGRSRPDGVDADARAQGLRHGLRRGQQRRLGQCVGVVLRGQLPDALDGIEVRTVRRKEVQLKQRRLLLGPSLMDCSSMIGRVVADGHDATSVNGACLLECLKKLEERLNQIPKTTNDNVKGIFEVIKDNYQLLQYFYFESLRYIKRLKNKDYSQLVEIVYLQDEKEKVKEFNKWIANDENLERLTKVFPIILTTNISSRKLGLKFKFDLLAIDEAGQCDIATSLIPISKCKNMVLIGDTNQLKPIVVFEESRNERLMKQFEINEIYDYFNNSILSVYKRIDNISRNILMIYHYRCGQKIINYYNLIFY